MRNVKITVDANNVLVIEADLNISGQLSKTGRHISVASTEGNQPIADRNGTVVMVELNIYRK